jgi:hypothetical protein
MAYPHTIRLRGPWQCQPLAREGGGPLPPPSRVFPPCRWTAACGDDFFGTVRFMRTFHPPRKLDPHERLWLVVDGADARGDVFLNGQTLGSVAGYALADEWDITELLRTQNELIIDVECLPGASAIGRSRLGYEHCSGGLTGEVRLEVRSSAFVAGLAVWAVAQKIKVSGTVYGAAGVGLALVVNGLGRELMYAGLTADSRFELEARVPDMPVWPLAPADFAQIEIKLVSGATAAWQAKLQTAASPMVRDCEGGEFTVLDEPVAWPTTVIGPVDDAGRPHTPASLEHLVQRRPCVGLGGMADAAIYDWFDQSATAVAQMLPNAWLHRVGPRLAHHPSIVAWAFADEGPPAKRESDVAFGRPILHLGQAY